MIKLIKLICYRIFHNKVFLMTYLVLIPIFMAIAVYCTNAMSYRMQVAIVNDVQVVENSNITFHYLDEVPKTSQLVLNQYDAILVQEGETTKVISTKGEEYDQAILMLVSGQIDTLDSTTDQRGTATNILGFLMMLVGLLGVQIYQYYFDERKGINKRIMSTSISSYQYMLSHFLVVLGFLFIPALIVISGAIIVFDISLSITMWQFVLVLLLLCVFSTSFGLWVNVMSNTIEESMMFGNMFAIVGTIISGGFVQVTDNEIFNQIVQIFPQKQIMSILNALENHTSLPSLGIVYILIFSIAFVVIGIIKEKRKLPMR